MNIEIKKINWIDVIFAPMVDSNSTTVQILVKAWSIYETKETNGISHFLEHMFFKWWKKYPTAKIVSQEIDKIWWEFNAFTWDEYAWYYVKSASEYVNKSLDVLSDMLVNPLFLKEEINKEKWVIIQEIMMYEDMPHRLVMDKRKNYFYWDNSYGRSTLGPVENIKSFNQDYFFFHKEWLYTKDNLVIVIAWNILNQDEIEELINNLFKNLPTKKTISVPQFPIDYKPENNISSYDKKTQQNHIIFWAKWFDMNDEKRFPSTLLWVILWWNMSSRLFQEVREKKWLCYYVSASHMASVNDWLFFIRAWLEKDRFDLGINTIHEELWKVVNWDITQTELDNALWYISWKTKMWIETSDNLADFVGEQYLLKWEIKTLEEILANYKKVKLDDLLEVTKKLDKNNIYGYYIK